ncbi:MAG: ABC transporter ATP-binding protein [Planctomycetota bacterium]
MHTRPAMQPDTAQSEMREKPAVEAIGAVYDYAAGRRRAGRRIGPVDLAVHPGERVAVIGPNGCGKSTLIHLLSGASTPHEGRVRWFGGGLTTEARRRIGVVFQSPSLDALLTVRETLRLAGRLLRMPRADIERRTRELVGELGIEDRIDSRIGTLSGGLARRVDLARAIMHGPGLLLLDEPTAGLDDESAAAFNTMVDGLARSGVAVVAATHTLDEVRLSHRVVVMIGGQVGIDESDAGSHHDRPARAVMLTGDAERLGGALASSEAEHMGGGTWRLDLAAASDESIASALRAAAEAGGQVTTADGSMQGYFAEAERRLAAPAPTPGLAQVSRGEA